MYGVRVVIMVDTWNTCETGSQVNLSVQPVADTIVLWI